LPDEVIVSIDQDRGVHLSAAGNSDDFRLTRFGERCGNHSAGALPPVGRPLFGPAMMRVNRVMRNGIHGTNAPV
jgi:hypothetical protein